MRYQETQQTHKFVGPDMVVQTKSQSKLHPDNPKDAEKIRRLLEESDSNEKEGDFYELHLFDYYSQALNENDTCET